MLPAATGYITVAVARLPPYFIAGKPIMYGRNTIVL